MRRIVLLGLAIMAVAGLSSCKTSESNYREAYERAIAGREERTDLDDTVYGQVRRQMQVRNQALADGSTVPVRSQHVRVDEDGGGIPQNLKRYNVVVGRFKQAFNARSLRNRLVDEGKCPGAFVVKTGEPYYYIVASSWADINDAAQAMATLPSDVPGLREPLPFILDATGRTREGN